MPKTAIWFPAAGLALLMLSGCAAGPNEMVDTGPDPAGFGSGSGTG